MNLKTKIQNETDQKRALHVVQENLRVIQAVAALRTGDLEAFGECMYEGHTSLRELYEVTIPEHDLIVRSSYAMRKDGVYGARMTGGGFGGSVIVAHAPTVRGVKRERGAAPAVPVDGRGPLGPGGPGRAGGATQTAPRARRPLGWRD